MMAKTFGQLGMQLGSISIAGICYKIINNICRQRKRPEQMFPKAETANLRRPSQAFEGSRNWPGQWLWM